MVLQPVPKTGAATASGSIPPPSSEPHPADEAQHATLAVNEWPLDGLRGFLTRMRSIGPVDYWLGWQPLKLQDRDRYPAGSQLPFG